MMREFPDNTAELLRRIDYSTGSLSGLPVICKRLSELRGSFHDATAYDAALAVDDALLYTVCSVRPAEGDGQMHYGLGILQPGKIGNEYFLTRGHYHSERMAAEIYIGLRGDGAILLEHEHTGKSALVRLAEGDVVYVPGHTAHRTVNTGAVPLAYLGVYPWNAGHDYGAIAHRNFLKCVVEVNGRPELMDRTSIA
jgi:glucose-6-phosphate isomerase